MMRYLFDPVVRFMNRLKYAYKFALIGLLIVMQASVLIYMLVMELNKNIDFANRERLGIEYSQALVGLLDEAQGYRRLHYLYSTGDRSQKEALLTKQARVDAAFQALETVDQRLNDQLDTTWKVQLLEKEWDGLKQQALQFEPERAQVAFGLNSRWIGEITSLIQYVGNSSNLALDADLDTASLVDAALRKLPALVDTLGQAQALGEQLSEAPGLSPWDKDRMLVVAGLVRSNLEQYDRSTQQLFRHNDKVKVQLKKFNDALDDSVPIFVWNFEQSSTGAQGTMIPKQLLVTGGQQAAGSVLTLYQEELKVIDDLLNIRIERYLRDRNAVIGFTMGILLLVFYLFLAFDMSVRRGVYHLNTVMESAAQGDLSVRGDIYSKDEMGTLTGAVNSMLDSLENMYEEVRQSRDQLEVWNQELEIKVVQRTAALRNLLDHAGQGFLSFGADLKVAGEYSAECAKIFKHNIAGELIPTLYYPTDRGEQVFLEALFGKIFQEQNGLIRETYLSLLPEELLLGESFIRIGYKIIINPARPGQDEIMLILTDRTLQRAMEQRIQEEQSILAMVVRVVTHSHDFSTAIRQYSVFCKEGLAQMLQEGGRCGERLEVVFRTVHTFKGTFGQLGMRHTVAELHNMETVLAEIRDSGADELENDGVDERLSQYTPQKMLDWLETDMAILKDILGESFFYQEETLVVESARLLEIEEKIQRILTPGECRLLIPEIRRLRFKPFKELLESYPEYVLNLAEKYERLVNPFEIEGGETFVDPLKYYDFSKSLGHVFRNALVHGLEAPDERLENGKEESGNISCTIREEADGLTLIIKDDGRGIDASRIREIAVSKGIAERQSLLALSDEEAIMLIFADGFSGAEDVSELAGRGVGLSAVREELGKVGGSVQVRTTSGHGTEFRFFLPLYNLEDNEPQSMSVMTKPLVDEAIKLLKNAGLPVINTVFREGVAGGKVALRKVTTFVDIKGMMKGKMLLSAEEAVVERLVAAYGREEAAGAPEDKWMETVIARCASDIFLSAQAQLPDLDDAVKAEALVTILAEDASAKYPQAEISTWMLETERGWLNLSLIY
ncbi:MAG: ATP-binding protein [Negativicutes bacterium]|nr:ATP-binding protein [Negativicutes bacterium]